MYPLPLLDSPNSINNPVMAGRLADTLGERPAALMKAHGAVTVGETIQDAFVLANYLEENSYRQYMAMKIGTPYAFSSRRLRSVRRSCGALPSSIGHGITSGRSLRRPGFKHY